MTLGNTPTQWFLGTDGGITELRGRFHRWKGGIEVFPMFHPSFLLRNSSKAKGSPKHLTWLDIQAVKDRLSFLDPTGEGAEVVRQALAQAEILRREKRHSPSAPGPRVEGARPVGRSPQS